MLGIEKGVIGMEIGDTKTVEISPGEAFGNRREELVVNVTKSDFPNDITPSLGQRLRIRLPDGNAVNVTISDLNGDTVTLDANHPLAGFTLFYDIELVEIS